jgi:hypothetical protein
MILKKKIFVFYYYYFSHGKFQLKNLNLKFFTSIYGGSNSRRGNRKIEKLKCIFHYFSRVTDKSKQ